LTLQLHRRVNNISSSLKVLYLLREILGQLFAQSVVVLSTAQVEYSNWLNLWKTLP